jgi:hypothetical protein
MFRDFAAAVLVIIALCGTAFANEPRDSQEKRDSCEKVPLPGLAVSLGMSVDEVARQLQNLPFQHVPEKRWQKNGHALRAQEQIVCSAVPLRELNEQLLEARCVFEKHTLSEVRLTISNVHNAIEPLVEKLQLVEIAAEPGSYRGLEGRITMRAQFKDAEKVTWIIRRAEQEPQDTRRDAPPIEPGFPSHPAIKDADPRVRSTRTFQVPTQLIVRREPERIGISVDTNSLDAVELKVGHKMVTGFKHEIFVISGGQRKHWGGGLGGTANMGTSYIVQKLDGIPKPGEKYKVEVTFVVFETDVPCQHMWMPQSGKYEELWTRTLKSGEL